MASWAFRVFVLLLSVLLGSCGAKRDAVVYCSACSAMVEEMIFSIGQIDPKKTVNVGGFRLSPDGTIRDKKVPLSRSEVHLSELLDGVCERMNDYALYEDPDSHEKRYRRFAPRENQDMTDLPDFNNFKFEGPEASALKFACETIREELEDVIITLLQTNPDNAQQELCSNMSGYCRASGRAKEDL
ncbi:protein canopy-1 [Boleophthalmus pectinirostris]|uniref:protein canopy-1 n=1 Tax=Boleophthalmus pectinirostris TaxID=150288 RepID=UPI002431B53A|nr:protein canopy-1 [Boleophthalmus pectinirostris]